MTMASVHRKNGDKTWQVFWRDPGGKQHAKRGFATKRDAKDYGTRMEASKLDGSYVDATRAGRASGPTPSAGHPTGSTSVSPLR